MPEYIIVELMRIEQNGGRLPTGFFTITDSSGTAFTDYFFPTLESAERWVKENATTPYAGHPPGG